MPYPSRCLTSKAVFWIGLAALLGGACSFPPYTVELASATAGASGAVTGGVGGQAGGAGASALGDSGAAGAFGASAGAAGEMGETGETAAWSALALERFGFSLLGSADLQPDGVRLTHDLVKHEVGGLAQQSALELAHEAGLHVSFGFRLQVTTSGGDGLAIILHASPQGHRALGSGGGALGYGGLSPCFAVELDTARIGDTELPAPHLAMVPQCMPEVHGPSTTALGGNPADGTDWLLSLDWDASSMLLDVNLHHVSTGHDTLMSERVDLIATLGPRAYVTVASANGEATATVAILSLSLGGGGLSARSLQNDLPASL